MKTHTKETLRRALIGLAILGALLLLGYLETEAGLPNH